jgi:pectinesterase
MRFFSYQKHFVLLCILILFIDRLYAKQRDTIIVDSNGAGDFTSLTEAINSLPMFNYERMVIFVKKGIYTEKIKIDQDYITLSGESRNETVIRFTQLRSDWEENKDIIGPAVININGDDVIIENLTIENTQPEIGPHAFAIYSRGTRTIIKQCNVRSRGGDTIALWNYKDGMYYLSGCIISGAVDFVCLRGWCFIRDCDLYEYKKTAAIWHAGGYNRDQKFVIVNCNFDGVRGFKLGRHHYEAQFYLLNCNFSETMSDIPIYYVFYEDEPERNRPFNWGKRYYFYNCHRQGSDYEWFADNLYEGSGSPKASEITAAWTFAGNWDPESTSGPVIRQCEIHDNVVLFQFREIVTVIGKPLLKTLTGKYLSYHSGGGSDTIRFDCAEKIERKDLKAPLEVSGGLILGTTASINPRLVNFTLSVR